MADGGVGWLEVSTFGDITTVELIGEFDVGNHGLIATTFGALEHPQVVVVDDGRLEFIGLEATRELLGEIDRLIAGGSLVRLRIAGSVLRRLVAHLRPDLVALVLRDR